MARLLSPLDRFPYTLLLILGLDLLMSCQNSPNSFRDKDVFRYNEFRNVTSLDPAFARNPQNIWPVNQIFNGLVQLDHRLEVQPDIAKAWTLSEDGLEYRFHLRDDVFFHESPFFWT